MRSLKWTGCCLALALFCSRVDAADQVKVGKKTHSGEIKSFTPTQVEIEVKGNTETFAVNEISVVRFNSEPVGLKNCRDALENGRLEDADKAIGRVKADEITRPEMKQDYDFYRAATLARLALAGSGDMADANLKIGEFIRTSGNSFHLIEALMIHGEIQVALNQGADAAETYTRVEQTAPWPDYKIRAIVAKGRALLGQSKGQESLTLFDEALALAGDAKGELVEEQKLLATVHRAQSLALLDRADEGVKIVEALITGASPDQKELHARAYTALGNCHLKAGRRKEAREAFLHVHLLYPIYADLHAEALAHLVNLWDPKEPMGEERSREAAELLKTRYGKSRWAKLPS